MADDDELKQRLEKLRGEKRPSVDQKELEERIARLKGIDPAKYTAPPITVYTTPDRRNDVEKADDLLKQLAIEADLDDNVDLELGRKMSITDDEIERRLRNLKGPSLAVDAKKVMGDDFPAMDSDEESELIAKRLVAEAELPDVVPEVMPSQYQRPPEQDELPWCVICNEDARICCKDCDDDLYCLDCFKEFHSDSDTRKHRSRAFAS